MAHQQQQQPQPAQVPRPITHEDYHQAYTMTVGRSGFPIPDNAPDVENTFWEFKRSRHSTGNGQWDLVKMQCFNKSNLVGNKRRDILPLLSASKMMKKKNQKLVAKYRNELKGLEEQLVAKIADFNQFVPGGFIFPRHFEEFPTLREN